MKTQQIKKFQSDVAVLINDGRFHDAFRLLRSFSESALNWEITTEIDSLEQNYRALLSFMANGADDPARNDNLAAIAADARALADRLARLALMPEETSLYFGTARTLAATRATGVTAAVEALRAELARLRRDVVSIADTARYSRAEQLSAELFNTVWTTHPMNGADIAATIGFATDTDIDMHWRAPAVSALAAGALEFYDAGRAEALLRVYMSPVDDDIALRALIGFFIIIFRYRRRAVPRRLAEAIAAAKDFPTWNDDLRNAAIEFMRSRDTERISKRLSEDIFPALTKIAPEIRDRFADGNIELPVDPDDANPDWDDLLNRDGLGDKLREISEIQADGGDVYMSSFSSLKHFPFFRDMPNWFLPFSPDHPAVAGADTVGMAETLRMMPFLCDNDKYSIAMALASAPSHLRDGAAAAMDAQNSQMRDMLSEVEKAAGQNRRKNIISNYVRDLYRFYNLFRRKSEFFNPFSHGIDLIAIDTLSDGFDDIDTLKVIAEFNLKHKFWEEAAALLRKIDNIAEPDAARAQKLGFCMEKLGQFARAVSHYEEASLLAPANKWLLERMAHTFRALGENSRAIEVLRQLDDLSPDDLKTTYDLGAALVAAHRPAEAVKQFYKAVYLAPQHKGSQRALAWALFLDRRFDEAAKAYDALLADNPAGEDYFNAGHTARALGNMREAISFYRRSMQADSIDAAQLEKKLADDDRWLVEAGVDTADNRLILEAILYAQQ